MTDLLADGESETKTGMDLSVIVVSWNTRDLLRNCLRSVYDQTRCLSFEVIVIDNASADGTQALVRSEFPQTILIENADNRGFAAANNQGMKIARGRYVLLLNPDTIILDGAIDRTLAYAEAHPGAGVVGCQVLENEQKIQRTCFSFPSVRNQFLTQMGLSRLFPRSRVLGAPDMRWWNRDTEMDVDVVSGMFMLVRRCAIEEVGRMDEDFFVYAEEADWCYRFRQAGWRCVFTPVARIIHVHGGGRSTSQVSTKMYVQLQKSQLLFHRKNLGLCSWFSLKLIYVASMLVRSGVWGLARLLGLGRDSRAKATQSLAALRFHLLGIEPS